MFALWPRVARVADAFDALGQLCVKHLQRPAEAPGYYRRALGIHLAPLIDAADVHLDVDVAALCERLRALSPAVTHEDAGALGRGHGLPSLGDRRTDVWFACNARHERR